MNIDDLRKQFKRSIYDHRIKTGPTPLDRCFVFALSVEPMNSERNQESLKEAALFAYEELGWIKGTSLEFTEYPDENDIHRYYAVKMVSNSEPIRVWLCEYKAVYRDVIDVTIPSFEAVKNLLGVRLMVANSILSEPLADRVIKDEITRLTEDYCEWPFSTCLTTDTSPGKINWIGLRDGDSQARVSAEVDIYKQCFSFDIPHYNDCGRRVFSLRVKNG